MANVTVSSLSREERESGRHFVNNTGDRAWQRWMRDLMFTADRLEAERDEAKKMLAAVLVQVGGVVVSGMTLRGVDWIGGRFVREESEHGGLLLRFEQGSSVPNTPQEGER